MTKAKPSSEKKQQPVRKPWKLLALGIFGLIMAYAFALWAIDTGSLWFYLFCFLSIYFAIDYLRQSIKELLTNHASNKKQSRKTRRS